jgi:hypothetical protein
MKKVLVKKWIGNDKRRVKKSRGGNSHALVCVFQRTEKLFFCFLRDSKTCNIIFLLQECVCAPTNTLKFDEFNFDGNVISIWLLYETQQRLYLFQGLNLLIKNKVFFP